MDNNRTVDGAAREISGRASAEGGPYRAENGPGAKQVVSTKYPLSRIKLLEVAQAEDGDQFRSDQVRKALDKYLEDRFPGAVKKVGGGGP